MNAPDKRQRPIGVFDSGVGGLTVLKGNPRCCCPAKTSSTSATPRGCRTAPRARTRSNRYASQAAGKLHDEGIKLLVVACNTASAVALDALREQFRSTPSLASSNRAHRPPSLYVLAAGNHLVLATEATVWLGAYRRAIESRDPAKATVRELACELLVSLAEEGWTKRLDRGGHRASLPRVEWRRSI